MAQEWGADDEIVEPAGRVQKPRPVAIDPLKPIFGGETAEETATRRAGERREERGAEIEEERLDIARRGEVTSLSEKERAAFESLTQRYEADPRVVKYVKVLPVYKTMLDIAASSKPSKAKDNLLVTLFNKIKDPTTGVLQGEQEASKDVQTITDKIQTELKGLYDPEIGFVSPAARRQFIEATQELIKADRLAYSAARSRFRQLASDPYMNLRPDAVIGPDFGDTYYQGIKENWLKIFPGKEEVAGIPALKVAEEGGPRAADRDIAVARALQAAWESGESIERLNEITVGMGTDPLPPQTIKALEDDANQALENNTKRQIKFTPFMAPTQDVTKDMGVVESIVESITGSERSTDETETLPDWTTMPELNQLSTSSGFASLGTMFTSPEESVKIIQSNFPDVQVRQDSKGNFILQSQNGQEYAIKPGFRWSDVPRAAGGLLAFLPSAGAKTIAGAAGGAGLTQAIIEGTQVATGGTYDPNEVLIAAGGGVVGKVLEPVIPAVVSAVRGMRGGPAAALPETIPVGAVPETPPMGIETPPAMPSGMQAPPAGMGAPSGMAPPTGAMPAASTPASSIATEQGISEDLIRLAREASGRGRGARMAQAELRQAIDADPAIIKQAEDIGIDLPADVFSANIQLRNLTGLARSQPGSAAQASWQQTVGDAAEQVQTSLKELGATSDLVGLSDRIFTRMNSSIDALEAQGDDLRNGINKNLNKKSPVNATNLQSLLADTINNLGGLNKAREIMSAEELKLLKALGVGDVAQQPTYAYMERLRRDLGRALKERRGPWADVDSNALNDYYDALAKDRIAHVQRELGGDAAERMAASNNIFKSMYAARNEMTDLFGRNLDKGIGGAIRSAILQGGKGEAQNVRKLFSLIPENMRSEAAFSGIIANAASKGGEGKFSFANFQNVYSSLRDKNTTIYNELAKNMLPEQRKFLENLYGVSRRIADAERRIERTGRALTPVAKEINAETLTQRIVDQATTRGVGATIGAVGGTAFGDIVLGTSLAVGLEAGLAALSRGSASNLDRVSNLIGSAPYRDLIDVAASGGDTTRAINRLSISKQFRDFAKTAGITGNPKDWLRSALAPAAVTQGEQSEPMATRPGAPMVITQ